MTDLRIETRKRADAECIANALDAPLSRTPIGWQITLKFDVSSDLGRLVAALQACLDEQEIPLVTVALDEDRYLMEALSPGTATG